jgi:LPXTG-motif cell wall-anchored protein
VSAETRVKISLSSQKTNPEIARPNLPSTGEQVTILLSIIGIILVIMVLVVFQKRRKKQKEEKG